MATVLVNIVCRADIWAILGNFLRCEDRLRMTLLISKSLVNICRQHVFGVSVKIVDIHLQSHYLHLGICWARDNSSLHDQCLQSSRLFLCRSKLDHEHGIRSELAPYKAQAPTEVLLGSASVAGYRDGVVQDDEMVRIVERNTRPQLPICWGQSPRPYLVRRLIEAPSSILANEGIDMHLHAGSTSEDEASLQVHSVGGDADEPSSEELVPEPERLGSHKYGATRLYRASEGTIRLFKAPLRWAPTFQETWADVHQEFRFAIHRLFIVYPQLPNGSLFNWLPNMNLNHSLCLIRPPPPPCKRWAAMRIDERFRGARLRHLAVKNNAFDEDDIGTCQFLRGPGLEQICIDIADAPPEWIRRHWLCDGSESLTLMQRSSQVYFHISSQSVAEGITLAECAKKLCGVLVSLAVPTVGAEDLVNLLRSPSPPIFDKLQLLCLGAWDSPGHLQFLDSLSTTDTDKLFPCLNSIELDSQLLLYGAPFLPSSLQRLSITNKFDVTNASRLITFCYCLSRVSSRCASLRELSIGFTGVTDLTEYDGRTAFVSLGLAPEWHHLESLSRLEVSLVQSLDVCDAELRVSMMHDLEEPDRIEAKRTRHARLLVSQLSMRLAFIRNLEETLGCRWKQIPTVKEDEHSWLASYNTVVLER